MAQPDPALDLHVQRLKALGHASRLSIVRVVVQGPVEGTSVGKSRRAWTSPARPSATTCPNSPEPICS